MRYVYGDKQILFPTVYRWFTIFSFGQKSVKDAPYSGRPRSAATKSSQVVYPGSKKYMFEPYNKLNSINKIESIIEADARFTVRQLGQMTHLGLASVHFILKKILKVMKISALWIPHLLTDKKIRTRKW